MSEKTLRQVEKEATKIRDFHKFFADNFDTVMRNVQAGNARFPEDPPGYDRVAAATNTLNNNVAEGKAHYEENKGAYQELAEMDARKDAVVVNAQPNVEAQNVREVPPQMPEQK